MAKSAGKAAKAAGKPCILVCVTRQKTCERLIRRGAELTSTHQATLEVVHVVKSNAPFLGRESDGEALEYLFGVSRQYGADMTLLRTDDVLLTLIEHACERHAVALVVGEPATTDWVTQMQNSLPGVEIVVVRSGQ